MAKNRNEEFEIEFIDGDDLELAVYRAMEVNQGNLHEFFDAVDSVDERDLPALQYLTTVYGMDFAEALEKVEDVSVFEGTAEDYAYEFLEDTGYPTGNDWYFDHEAFGRDISNEGTMAPDPDEYDEGEDDDDYIEALGEYESLSHKALGEQAVDYWGGIGEMPAETVQRYFDHEAFARDATINGDWAEISLNGQDYVITNASGF